MICNNCGSVVDPTRELCDACGKPPNAPRDSSQAKLTDEPERVPPTPPAAPEVAVGENLLLGFADGPKGEAVQKKAPRDKRTTRRPAVTLLVVALVLAGSFAVLYNLPYGDRKKILRVDACSTIGAKLIPELAAGFLEDRGLKVETSYNKDGQPVAVRGVSPQDDSVVEIQLQIEKPFAAFRDLAAGKCDITFSTREMKTDESDLFGQHKVAPPESGLKFAYDGIVVILHPNNPIEKLTKEEVADIFSATRDTWAQFAGGRAQHINVYVPNEHWDIYERFSGSILGDRVLKHYKKLNSEKEVVDKVAADEAAVGFVSRAYASERPVKQLQISKDGKSSYGPREELIINNVYPLSQPLYMYTLPSRTTTEVEDFIRFVREGRGQQIIGNNKYIKMSPPVPRVCYDAPESYNRLTEGARRLPFEILFESGQSRLRRQAVQEIEKVQRYLEENTGLELVLLGFADMEVGRKDNQVLSRERADAVRRALQSRRISIKDHLVEGLGSSCEVAGGTTDKEREQNRRVEVWVRNWQNN